ncbi:hypothetical protein DFJ73DRAFT_507500 [Zopfochytrium polystomum]|nr:hypothetical protein DFJ73DRAFT_507500 [Zopfochytrium polystomum]
MLMDLLGSETENARQEQTRTCITAQSRSAGNLPPIAPKASEGDNLPRRPFLTDTRDLYWYFEKKGINEMCFQAHVIVEPTLKSVSSSASPPLLHAKISIQNNQVEIKRVESSDYETASNRSLLSDLISLLKTFEPTSYRGHYLLHSKDNNLLYLAPENCSRLVFDARPRKSGHILKFHTKSCDECKRKCMSKEIPSIGESVIQRNLFIRGGVFEWKPPVSRSSTPRMQRAMSTGSGGGTKSSQMIARRQSAFPSPSSSSSAVAVAAAEQHRPPEHLQDGDDEGDSMMPIHAWSPLRPSLSTSSRNSSLPLGPPCSPSLSAIVASPTSSSTTAASTTTASQEAQRAAAGKKPEVGHQSVGNSDGGLGRRHKRRRQSPGSGGTTGSREGDDGDDCPFMFPSDASGSSAGASTSASACETRLPPAAGRAVPVSQLAVTDNVLGLVFPAALRVNTFQDIQQLIRNVVAQNELASFETVDTPLVAVNPQSGDFVHAARDTGATTSSGSSSSADIDDTSSVANSVMDEGSNDDDVEDDLISDTETLLGLALPTSAATDPSLIAPFNFTPVGVTKLAFIDTNERTERKPRSFLLSAHATLTILYYMLSVFARMMWGHFAKGSAAHFSLRTAPHGPTQTVEGGTGTACVT